MVTDYKPSNATSNAGDAYSGGMLYKFAFSKPVLISGIWYQSSGGGSLTQSGTPPNPRAGIWEDSSNGGAVIAKGISPSVPATWGTGVWVYFPFASPVSLLANRPYRLGTDGQFWAYQNRTPGGPYSIDLGSGLTLTDYAFAGSQSGNTFNGGVCTDQYTTAGRGNIGFAWALVNQLPTAPTNFTLSKSSANYGDTVTGSWTHNDADGNPQYAYKYRWRKAVA